MFTNLEEVEGTAEALREEDVHLQTRDEIQ